MQGSDGLKRIRGGETFEIQLNFWNVLVLFLSIESKSWVEFFTQNKVLDLVSEPCCCVLYIILVK